MISGPLGRRLRLLARKSCRVGGAARPVPKTLRRPRDDGFRRVLLTVAPDLVELGFVLVLCVGVGFIYWPAALILFGILGVVACERRSAMSAQAALAQTKRVTERVA